VLPTQLHAAVLTDPGKVRRNNEDSCFADGDLGLLIVADGMGGHAAGEVASHLAVQVIRDQVVQALRTGKIPARDGAPLHLSDRARLLDAAVHLANDMILETAQKSPERRGMGTTVVAALLSGRRLAVAHVGDSRLYLLRKGEFRQITQDHSLVAEQVAKGLLTPEQAETSEIQNVLSRALGVKAEVEVDVTEPNLENGDLILLCSDGLSRMVKDGAISAELSRLKEPTEMCHNLVRLALEQGGRDNVTVAVGRVQSVGLWSSVKKLWRRPARRTA